MSAMTGAACIPVDPVPICPTRFPLNETVSCGQFPVWYHFPLKVESPGISGTFAVDMHPIAVMRNVVRYVSPVLVATSQTLSASIK